MNKKRSSDRRAAHDGFGMLGVPIPRRTLLQSGIACSAGMFVGGGLPQSAPAATDAGKRTQATSVIQIWMWGGPAHLDTFDPKPQAGYDYCGPLDKPIASNIPGIHVGQLLPVLAQQADKYSIIRGMTHGVNAHETASYMVQTGRKPGGRLVYPCVGAVVSRMQGYGHGYDGLIPPYVVLTQPQGRFSEAGFLGSRYKPFATGGDPSKARFEVEGVVAAGISDQRQRDRRDLLYNLNTLARKLDDNQSLGVHEQAEAKAYDLILGDAGKVFELAEEKDALREQYGRNTFGQSCLIARRLVERGVKYVTINYKGWDTHKQHFQIMRRKLPELDRGLGTLLQDLSDRGMLDSTIVWWSGEFGRTPKVQWDPPWNGGRGHYGRVFSSVVAGGGFQGGQVVGASDDKGIDVQDRPVYPGDVIGSMYSLLGIDPESTLPHPQGFPVRITPSADEFPDSGGRLKEIV